MSSNLQPSSPFQGGNGNHASPRSQQERANHLLRAYIDAPTGKAVDAVFRALSYLSPAPTYPEAADLAKGIPEPTRTLVLTRFRTACLGAEDRQGCADGGWGHYVPCECPRKPRTGQGGKVGAAQHQDPPRSPEEGAGSQPKACPILPPLPRKARAVKVLRAYLQAPGGLGVEAVFRCLTTLEPLPTYREAVQLSEKLPSGVGARSLARFFAFLQAVERIQAQREEAGTLQARKPAQAFVTPDRTDAPDWVPVREGGAA